MSSSQSVVWGPAALASPENSPKIQIPDLLEFAALRILDLLSQEPGGKALAIPGDSDAHTSLRVSALEKGHQSHLGTF